MRLAFGATTSDIVRLVLLNLPVCFVVSRCKIVCRLWADVVTDLVSAEMCREGRVWGWSKDRMCGMPVPECLHLDLGQCCRSMERGEQTDLTVDGRRDDDPV